NMTDSIVALAAGDGAIAWHVQTTTADVFTQKHPDSPDHDFGSTPVLAHDGPRTLAVIGAKSSVVWAVDVATGKVAWQQGKDSPGEGVIGDGALGDGVVAVPFVTLQKVVG